MPLNFQQLLADAGKLVNDITTHENAADLLICEIQSIGNQIDSMKQYQEDVETLNTQSNQKPREEIVSNFQKGTIGYFRELQAENKELRHTLEDYQNALELIMSKYRQQTAYFLKQNKTEISKSNIKCCGDCKQCKCVNIIHKQALRINEMKNVMRAAALFDEENEKEYLNHIGQIKKENLGLREIINLANKYSATNCDAPSSEEQESHE